MRTPGLALVCLGLVHGSVHPRPSVLPRASLRATSPSSSRRAILAAATRCVDRSRPELPLRHYSTPRQRQMRALGQALSGGRLGRSADARSGCPATPDLSCMQAAAAATCAAPPTAHAAGQAREVLLTTSASGLKWGDIRPGVGNEFAPGQTVTIDYMMTKRAGAQQIPTLPWPWP